MANDKFDAVRAGLAAEGLIDTPLNEEIYNFFHEHKAAERVVAKDGPHKGHTVAIRCYGALMGVYEWSKS